VPGWCGGDAQRSDRGDPGLRGHIEWPGERWRKIAFQPTGDPSLASFGGRRDIMGGGSMVLTPLP
jgi:hypothetical protein